MKANEQTNLLGKLLLLLLLLDGAEDGVKSLLDLLNVLLNGGAINGGRLLDLVDASIDGSRDIINGLVGNESKAQ
jgi:hypothetical protein